MEFKLSATDFRLLRIQLVVHAVGGLLLLCVATVLSVYKLWGMTRYGLRKQHERRDVVLAGLPFPPKFDVEVIPRATTKTPRWVYVVGIHAAGLALLFLIVHLTGGSVWNH